MEKNKTGKYFKYAIGEIVLVVIGILIALSINNWNEQRKDGKTETQALINLKAEFVKNMERFDFLKTIKHKQENEGRTYLEIITNDTIPLTQKKAARPANTYNGTWNPSIAVLNSLFSTGDIGKIKNDSLKILLTNWPSRVDRFKELEETHTKKLEKRSEFSSTTFYRTIVKPGDYSEKWPGNYYPNNVNAKNELHREEFLENKEHYNALTGIITSLYIQQIVIKEINEDYKKISRLIDQELKIRKIDLNKSLR
jgi:hypothetical protein